MHVHYVSDIHLESGKFFMDPPGCTDVIVIAGDLGPNNMALNWLEDAANRLPYPILYVPGNHCFWDRDLRDWVKQAKKFCADIGVDLLYNDVVEIGDTVFLGTTLWTDFDLHGHQPLKMLQASTTMNDYKHITLDGRNIRPEEILAEHHQARGFLEEQLGHYSGRKRCVVTHHAPSKRSVSDAHNRYAPYYASNLDELILRHQPDVWLHGHVHSTVQYFIGETMVATNPRGHVDLPPPHRNQFFAPQYVLEF